MKKYMFHNYHAIFIPTYLRKYLQKEYMKVDITFTILSYNAIDIFINQHHLWYVD